jgi:hypothetical protein
MLAILCWTTKGSQMLIKRASAKSFAMEGETVSTLVRAGTFPEVSVARTIPHS